MVKVWPECNNDLFSIRNVSYGCHLLVLSVRFPLCSTEVLAALPHLQKVMDLGHSVQFSFLCFSLQFYVIFGFGRIESRIIACRYPGIASWVLPHNDSWAKGLACGNWLPLSNNVSPRRKTGLLSHTMWYERQYVVCHIAEIGIHWPCFFLLVPPVGNIGQPTCTAHLNWVRVVVITIWINLPPGVWCFRRWIQMEPCRGQWAYCVITASGCHFSHILKCYVFIIIAGQMIWIKWWLTRSTSCCGEGVVAPKSFGFIDWRSPVFGTVLVTPVLQKRVLIIRGIQSLIIRIDIHSVVHILNHRSFQRGSRICAAMRCRPVIGVTSE